MRQIRGLILILVIAGLAAGAGWYFANQGQSDANPAADGEIPSLAAPGGTQRHLPAPKETTGGYIPENTELTAFSTEDPGNSTPAPVESDDDIPLIDVTSDTPTSSPASVTAPIETITIPDVNNIDPNAKPGLAVVAFDLKGNIPAAESQAGEILADLLLAEIDSQAYDLYERGQIRVLLAEQRFQESDLISNSSKAAKFGRFVGIRYLVIGSLSRLGSEYHLTARVVDCQTGLLGERGSVSFRSINDAADALPELVNLLGLRLGDQQTAPGQKPDQPAKPLTGIELIDAFNPDAAFAVTIRTDQNKTEYVEGESIRFVVESDRDCFVTLITVDAAGDMTLLLPNAWQPRAFVRRNQPTMIPDTNAGFKFPIIPPHGQTRIKAVATLQPLPLRSITQQRLSQEKFVGLGNTKAIGITGDPQRMYQLTDSPLHQMLQPTQWATCDLTIITAATQQDLDDLKKSQPPVQPIAPTPAPVPEKSSQIKPLQLSPSSSNPNQQVLDRWRQLTHYRLPPAPDLLAQTPPSSSTNEYLIVRKSSPNAIRKINLAQGQSKSTEAGLSIDTLKSDPDIVTVAPNITVKSYSLPPTRLIDVQWALKNNYSPGHDIGYEQAAAAIAKLDNLPLIGLVDTGFNHNDPRLEHAAWTNPNEIPGNNIDDDGNGYVDDVHGWNFIAKSNKLYHPGKGMDHGTFIASVIAARPTGNDHDVVGVLPQAKIITAVAMQQQDTQYNFDAEGDLLTVIRAIQYVADQGAKVINLSFGRQITREQLEQINQLPIWASLESRGVLLICAAGNSNANNDANPVFPASLPRKNIIAVLATDVAGDLGKRYDPSSQQWQKFTNYGEQSVDIAAPGTLILGVSSPTEATLMSGSSCAAPFVTAAAALWRGRQGNVNTLDKNVLLKSVVAPREALTGYCRTGATVDLRKIVLGD